MAQEQIKGQAGALGSGGSLDTYVVPGAVTVTPYAVSVTFDGTGAGGSFLPCLTFKTITGAVIARCPASAVSAGGQAEVSWFPSVGGAAEATLEVTDGSHTVTNVTEVDFTSGATVSSGGAGIADVAISAAAPLEVTDGATTVTNVTEIDFTSGATVTSGGAGIADVAISASGGGSKNPPLLFQLPDATGNGHLGFFSSANTRILVPAFANGVDGFWYGVIDVPSNYVSTPAIVLWVLGASAGAGNSSRFIVATRAATTAASWDQAYTAETAQAAAMNATALIPTALTFSLSTTPVASNSLQFYIERNGSNVADAYAHDVLVVKAVFTYA